MPFSFSHSSIKLGTFFQPNSFTQTQISPLASRTVIINLCKRVLLSYEVEICFIFTNPPFPTAQRLRRTYKPERSRLLQPLPQPKRLPTSGLKSFDDSFTDKCNYNRHYN